MKIAAFVGSPHKNGNTARVVKQILTGAQSKGATTEIFYLYDYNIKPCLGCRYCEEKNVCKIVDDDVPLLHRAIRESNAIVLGTPTYYGDITGQFKQFVDRCYPFCKIVTDGKNKMEFYSIIPERKLGILVAVSGSMGPEVFDSHIKVAGHCFNDINAVFWRKILVPFTTWTPVTTSHAVMAEAFSSGVELVDAFNKHVSL
ncbi:NADPH-dependent FMN reductase [Neomoorella glycerini]|uniref:NADPH-dependent FMN reductase n=1 Tax=Neomoorella glycerini TaxID=55779 RepID=A0A6I5ZML6_9FIRM|nr:flavodoxin family protein [Moorella glycerini]QGP91108.1 NADPH-dependent FMN reductase [Moorella glycerini]